MPNQDNPNLKNSWENKTVLFIALLALFTAKFLPNHIEHKQIEHKKQEIQNQKIKVAKTTQIEEQKINIQNLQQEYSDILNLAKKLGITVVFVKDKIEFHCDSQINFEYLQTRLTQLGIPALSERPNQYGSQTPANFEQIFKITINLSERGQLLPYMDKFEKADI